MVKNSQLEWANYLDNLCSAHGQRLDKRLQSLDRAPRIGIYIDVLRAIDVAGVQPTKNMDFPTYIHRFVTSYGLNGASSALLCRLPQSGIPIRVMKEEEFLQADKILSSYGAIELVQRAATFIRAGHAQARRKRQQVSVEFNKEAFAFFADELESQALDEIELQYTAHLGPDPARLDSVDAIMKDLIKPWQTKYGTLIGYDAAPEVDEHYLSIALQVVHRWALRAGLDPRLAVGDIPAGELIAMLVFIVSVRLKHINFVRIAKDHVPGLQLLSSFTIWKEKAVVLAEVSDFTGLPTARVEALLKHLFLSPSDSARLAKSKDPIFPLGVDLENGFYIEPVCGILENPVTNLLNLMKLRDPGLHVSLSAPREGWFRTSIYGLFQGTRYHCVEGNVRLKKEGKVLTDVDAAIYQRDTNCLALFQLKWQDFGSLDGREVSSKARNLVRGINKWTDQVGYWEETASIADYRSTFRIPEIRGDMPFKVLHFGVCKNASRISGFSGESFHEGIAVANWPQFFAARREFLGEPDSFQLLHSKIRSEYRNTPAMDSYPLNLQLGEERIRLENLIHTIQ